MRASLPLVAIALLCGLPAVAASKPNVVLIVVDDLGYGELGCQGNAQIPTPSIDSIAAGGVRFTQGYVTAPFCSPSRAGLLTGRYQTRFGFEFNPVGKANLDPTAGLPATEKTVADRLKTAGYATALVGKWHLGGTEGFTPQKRGFDEFFGFLHEGHTFAPHYFPGLVSHLRVREPPYDTDNPLLRGDKPIDEPTPLTTAFAREATAFIDRNAERPFFLYLPFNAVHSPMQTSAAYFDKFRHIENTHRRVFAAMLAELDDAVGTVLGKLRERKLEEKTLIVFISDNGGPTAELTSQNAPLRGGKGQLYEGGIRVPFIIQWKGTLPSAAVYDKPVISLDATATILAAAGVAATPDADGIDLRPLIAAASPTPSRTFYWRYGRNIAIRQGDLKLVRQSAPQQQGAFELYDLAADVSEKTDLAAARPADVERLKAELEKLDAQMKPPIWSPERR